MSETENLLTVKEFIRMLMAGIADGSWTDEEKLLLSADPEGNRYTGFTNEISYAQTHVADGRFAPTTAMVTEAAARNAVVLFPMYEIDTEV